MTSGIRVFVWDDEESPHNSFNSNSTKINTEDGPCWKQLKEFLLAEKPLGLGRTSTEVNILDSSTQETLQKLGNPDEEDPFDIRGLVIGYVQSGKTQHFSVLAAKALDVGYQMIIVLSGLENSLRNQTQKRLMRDLGHQNWEGEGVILSDRRTVDWMTQVDESPGTGDFEDHEIFNPDHNYVAVIKKQKDRIENMIEYLNEKTPKSLSLLVIDDESDQASIDTSNEDSPTIINGLIRVLLNTKERSTYVGYTATPFANILTDPDAWSEPAGSSLFPKDFIDLLPEPDGPRKGGKYTGTRVFFGDEAFQVFERVSEEEASSINFRFTNFHNSKLAEAVLDYFIASAALLARSEPDSKVPRLMLIHTAHLTSEHESTAARVIDLCNNLGYRWNTKDDELLRYIEERWENSFRNSFDQCTHLKAPFQTFEEIKPFIGKEITSFDTQLNIRILNSENPGQQLDFDAQPGLRAIAIGGNKLSRGFTIEGLLTTYYVRNTQAGDTLMQMGRWFGYRGDFLDLIRVYTTDDLFADFEEMNQIEDELRAEIIDLKHSGKKPYEMPPALSLHPGIAFTAKNKMRDAVERQFSWSAQQANTLRLPFDDIPRLEENLQNTKHFISSLGEPFEVSNRNLPTHLPHWVSDITDELLKFIETFETDFNEFPGSRIVDYIKTQNDLDELTRWNIVVDGLKNPQDEFENLDLSIANGKKVHPIKRTRHKRDTTRLGALWDSEHYSWGLTDGQIAESIAYHNEYRPIVKKHKAYATFRNPEEALLVIYPISRFATPSRNASGQFPIYSSSEVSDYPDVIALGISFPRSQSTASRSKLTVASRGVQ